MPRLLWCGVSEPNYSVTEWIYCIAHLAIKLISIQKHATLLGAQDTF